MTGGRITEFFGERGMTVGDLAGEDLNEFYAYLDDKGLTAATALSRAHSRRTQICNQERVSR